MTAPLAKEEFKFVVAKAEHTLKNTAWHEGFYMREKSIGQVHFKITNGPLNKHRPSFYFELIRKPDTSRKEGCWPSTRRVDAKIYMWFGSHTAGKLEVSGTWEAGGQPLGFGVDRFTWPDLLDHVESRGLIINVQVEITAVSHDTNDELYHLQRLREGMESLLAGKTGKADLELQLPTPSAPLHVHRAVLSARSEYFAKMLAGAFSEGKSNTVDLTHLDAEYARFLPLLIHYMYTASVSAFQNLAFAEYIALYKLADMYQVRPIMHLTVQFLNKQVPTATSDDLAKLLAMVQTTHMDATLVASIRQAVQPRFDDIWNLIIVPSR